MTGTSPAGLVDRIRHHLVGLKMPRALEVLDHILRRLECGEIGAPEALEALLGEELTLREAVGCGPHSRWAGCSPSRR
jgi:hypothetical protein